MLQNENSGLGQNSRHPNSIQQTLDVIRAFGLTNEAALNAILAFWDYEVAVELLCEAIDRDEAIEDFMVFLEENFRTPTEPIGSVICDSSTCCNSSTGKPIAGDDTITDEEFLRELFQLERGEPAICTPPGDKPRTAQAHDSKTFLEFVPDERDLRMLAWAYLDEFIKLDMHMFTTGWSEKSHKRLERFEAIAKCLGADVRREIIDDLDDCQARGRGDVWHVYKQACESGFWTRPIDTAAVLREADSILSVFDDQLHHFGEDFLRILRKAKARLGPLD